jgi:uncharacterized membrane-anchored protein YhcB (DUF1043 family)
MNAATMKWTNWILSLIIVIASGVLCQQIISNSLSNQQDKNDYAELNSVKYGLLSIDEWKRQVTEILAEEINQLYLSKANERVLRKHIEVLLNTLIDEVDKKIRKENSGTAGGQIAQSFINIFVNLKEIKKGIPEYARAVIHEMTKPKSKRQIKAVLNRELDKYSDQTFDTQGTPRLGRILLRTDTSDIEGARAKLKEKVSVRHALIVKESGVLVLMAVILFALSGFSKLPLTPSRYIFLILSLVTLLIAGVTTPTIDMEATISQMNFMLIGHPIHFENQVLYFQSKSILDVFWIMITHKDFQMKLVGILLITFSIVFPVLKIISSMGYYFNFRKLRDNAVIRFFVLKSGKWSMADVMVVAIFMAYIGFNGIISSQLGHLRSADKELVILTTNATALQPGFYLFLTYTLLALMLTGFLTRKPLA